MKKHLGCSCSRRDFLAKDSTGSVSRPAPAHLEPHVRSARRPGLAGHQRQAHPNRILVVVELSGGNDGLNTVVPFGDAACHRARPKLGIKEGKTIRIADGFGFHPSMVGFERLYKDGRLAVVHGCGYDHPSLSRFSSMGYWHTGDAANGGKTLGWLGRLADRTFDACAQHDRQPRHRRSRWRCAACSILPLVFDDPARFRREEATRKKRALADLSRMRQTTNPTLGFCRRRRKCCRELRGRAARHPRIARRSTMGRAVASPAAPRVAALIAAEMPTRVCRDLRRQLVRHPRAAGGSPHAPADMHRRRRPRLHGRHEPTRSRRRGGDDDLHGVRPPLSRTAASAPTTARPRRCSSSGVASREDSTAVTEPHRSRRWQHEDDDRFPARLRR